MEGKEERGASSPERPALHMPEPLSITTGVPFSSAIHQIIINVTYLASVIWPNTAINTDLPTRTDINRRGLKRNHERLGAGVNEEQG